MIVQCAESFWFRCDHSSPLVHKGNMFLLSRKSFQIIWLLRIFLPELVATFFRLLHFFCTPTNSCSFSTTSYRKRQICETCKLLWARWEMQSLRSQGFQGSSQVVASSGQLSTAIFCAWSRWWVGDTHCGRQGGIMPPLGRNADSLLGNNSRQT